MKNDPSIVDIAALPHPKKLQIVIALRLLMIPFMGGSFGEIIASFLFFHITCLIVHSFQLRRYCSSQ